MKVISYNVKTGTPTPERAESVIKNITDFDADIVGTQEINFKWLKVLEESGFFDTYAMIGKSRHAPDEMTTANEYSSIFYKKDIFDVIDSGTKWLSETPDEVSKLESSKYYRIMTYAVFERKSDGVRFLHVNTHLDFIPANPVQIGIMLDLVKELGYDLPTMYTGDFNMYRKIHEGYPLMIEAGTDDSEDIALEVHVVRRPHRIGKTIDFCFLTKGDFDVQKYERYDLPGSDHDPVCVTLDIIKKEEV